LNVPINLSDFFQHTLHVLYAVVIGIIFEISSNTDIPTKRMSTHFVNAEILILGYFFVITITNILLRRRSAATVS
jgi:hypothetical protein